MGCRDYACVGPSDVCQGVGSIRGGVTENCETGNFAYDTREEDPGQSQTVCRRIRLRPVNRAVGRPGSVSVRV
jgi:hypothetical protein